MAVREGYMCLRESTMLFFGLFGGWPGATAGRWVFHHKTRKTALERLYWLTVALNFGGFVIAQYGDEANLLATNPR